MERKSARFLGKSKNEFGYCRSVYLDDCYGWNHAIYCVFCGVGRGLKNGDTGMYEIDFVSVVIGYIFGVLLAHSTSHLFFVETNDEGE